MIVDCHGHFIQKESFLRIGKKYATDELAKRAYERISQSPDEVELATTHETWVESLDQYGVDKVLLQTAPFGSSDGVAEFINNGPSSDRFVGIANIDMMDPEGSKSVQEVERVKELGLKGIGELYPSIGPWDPADEKLYPVYEKAQELELPIMLHLSYESYPASFVHLRYDDPYLLDPVLRNFPDLPFIICHMGIDKVHHLYILMKARKNVYAEISSNSVHVPTPYSGFFNITPQQVMEKFINQGFADRLMWGTDVRGPYFLKEQQNLKPRCGKTIEENNVVKILDEINVSEEDKAKILGENAKRLFKL